MPKLKHVGSKIEIIDAHGRLHLDFRSLERAPAIRVDGGIYEINLDALKIVDNDLIIGNCAQCSPSPVDLDPDTGFVASLPSLVSVGYIKLAGYIRSIGLASLASAGPPTNASNSELSTDSGARFHLRRPHNGSSLDLTSLNLSMPALKEANATIHIDASEPLDINLPLESAVSIDLSGRITSIHLPSFFPDTSITLSSTYKCESNDPNDSTESSDTITSLTNVICPIPSSGLSMAAKIGIGVGTAVGASIVIGGLVLFYRRRKSKKGERPPGYSRPAISVVSGVSGSGRQGAEATASLSGPDAPPPPYSPRLT
ncbi:hypothetical protein BJY04DRAFT_219106 [Aspergillus karnatakaensis]|uniref:LPXTG cell wall anchor domain-containing protein n=1 Tax=Aspergillus karnatakaensis TaxID=1810916 RepID=UPI003CCDC98D